MRRGTAAAALILLAAAVANAAPASAVAELDAARQECIGAARDTQRQEQAVAALVHDTYLLGREAGGRQRGLDESRGEQARLLGLIERLARNPPDRTTPGRFTPNRFAIAAEAPIDRIRSKLLLEAAIPALQAEARALAGEIERIAALRVEIAAKQEALAAARDALGKDREHLAQLVAHRLELDRRILPVEAGAEVQIARLGHEASDVGDLLKRADVASSRYDKELLARARAALPRGKADALTLEEADPTWPPELHAFDPPHSALTIPVSGTISQRFGAADDAGAAGTTSQGMRFAALPGGEAVASFDGRVIYAGPFGKLGLVLIVRHGLYHMLLAGLGRVDIKPDQWVLAGEPVGTMPAVVDKAAGTLYVELWRDGRPVDPQPYLAARDEGNGGPDGNQKVRE